VNDANELAAKLRAKVGSYFIVRNEFGALEVTFHHPNCDPGFMGWGVGDDEADALESALESEAFLSSRDEESQP
jgi:hypothetical protein